MASRFWVGGTGTWDASDTTHWAATSGGAGGQTVPGSSDTVTLDGSSGGGTVTVNTTVTVQSITCGAFTGTLDFSANNNNVTLSSSFSGTGSGTRTINLGNGTWTFTSTSGTTLWNMGTTTGLTFSANSSALVFAGNTATGGTRTFSGGGLTYNSLELAAQTSGGSTQVSGVNTFGVLTVTGQNNLVVVDNQTITTFNVNGTSGASVGVLSSAVAAQRTLTITTLSADWAAFRSIVGSGTATNSMDLGNNSGITITPPSGGAAGVLGSANLSGGFL